jgi:hypothetical protein
MTDWFSLGVVIEMTRNGKPAKQNGNEMEVRFVVTGAFCDPPTPRSDRPKPLFLGPSSYGADGLHLKATDFLPFPIG